MQSAMNRLSGFVRTRRKLVFGIWIGLLLVSVRSRLEKAESSGFPLILIVLLAVFGSVPAALLPVGLGVAAVLITAAVVYFISLALTMP